MLELYCALYYPIQRSMRILFFFSYFGKKNVLFSIVYSEIKSHKGANNYNYNKLGRLEKVKIAYFTDR